VPLEQVSRSMERGEEPKQTARHTWLDAKTLASFASSIKYLFPPTHFMSPTVTGRTGAVVGRLVAR
jgi:hypothetical protein